MLGKGRHERGQVLEQLVGSAMLVQGCWVVQSALVVPKEKARLRLARDYVVSPPIRSVWFTVEKSKVCHLKLLVPDFVVVVFHSKSLIDQEGPVGHFKSMCSVVRSLCLFVCVCVCVCACLCSVYPPCHLYVDQPY